MSRNSKNAQFSRRSASKISLTEMSKIMKTQKSPKNAPFSRPSASKNPLLKMLRFEGKSKNVKKLKKRSIFSAFGLENLAHGNVKNHENSKKSKKRSIF